VCILLQVKDFGKDWKTRIIGIHMGGGGAIYNEGEALYNQTREWG